MEPNERELAPSDLGGAGKATQRVWFAQALRGLACIIVVWEHLGHDFLAAPWVVTQLAFTPADANLGVQTPGFMTTLFGWLDKVHLWPGGFGVTLFLLISGFVIPFSLERNTVGGFFTRRFFRLYPTLWVAIGATLSVLAVQAYVLGTPFPYGRKVIGSSAGLFGAYLGKAWVDPVYWTLAIEELFYVIAAVCAWRGVLHRRVTVLLVGAALTTACLVLAPPAPTTSVPPLWYLRTQLSRNAAFVVFILIGVVFHEHYRRTWPGRTCLAIGAVLIGLYAGCLYAGPFAGNEPVTLMVPSMTALGVFATLYLARERLPHVRVLDWLADVSYPLYLVHTVIGWILMRAFFEVIPNYYVVVPLVAAIVIVLAAAIHYAVEVPTNRLGRRLGSRPPKPAPTPELVEH